LHIHVQVDAVSNGEFPWRHMPDFVSCILNASPKPSSVVNSTSTMVDIIQLDFNYVNLFLNLSWLHPSHMNGIIVVYELRIAPEPSNTIDYQSVINRFSSGHTMVIWILNLPPAKQFKCHLKQLVNIVKVTIHQL